MNRTALLLLNILASHSCTLRTFSEQNTKSRARNNTALPMKFQFYYPVQIQAATLHIMLKMTIDMNDEWIATQPGCHEKLMSVSTHINFTLLLK